MNFRLNL